MASSKNSLEILTTPLTAEEIEWRVQSSKNGKTQIAPYITARAVQARFDAAFGPFGWQNELRPIEKGFLCGIAVQGPDGQWVWKWDGSDESDIEPIKGAISGALKRAAVHWGLGRELYSYPKIYITQEVRYVPNEVLKRLAGLPEAIKSGKSLPEVILLNPDGSDGRRQS
jgi:hypothetical protein